MPKKSTKPEQLSEQIHITVKEMKNPGGVNLDHMFLEVYAEQASPSEMLRELFSSQSLREMMNGLT